MMIQVNGRSVEWEEGMTVADVIRKMKYTFPMLVVTVDGRHVPKKKYPSTPVPDGAEVRVLHLGQGG